MLYLLGTDEAGYGPSLGPLVIGASLWKIDQPPESNDIDLYDRLSAGVSDSPSDPAGRLAIADSKKLYSSGASLERLERVVLAAMRLLNRPASSREELWQALGMSPCAGVPWQQDHNDPLPCDSSSASCDAAHTLLRTACREGRAELIDLRGAVLQPELFNARCTALGNKAAVLTAATLGLVRSLLEHCAEGPVLITCDKHGGRNSYAAMVLEEVTQHDVVAGPLALTTLNEGRDLSAYRWRKGNHERCIRFMAGGERFLPAALASMLAKYVRELSMRSWNAFWKSHLPDLAPTAGYPLDARRFRLAIEPLTRKWEWDESLWWRQR